MNSGEKGDGRPSSRNARQRTAIFALPQCMRRRQSRSERLHARGSIGFPACAIASQPRRPHMNSEAPATRRPIPGLRKHRGPLRSLKGIPTVFRWAIGHHQQATPSAGCHNGVRSGGVHPQATAAWGASFVFRRRRRAASSYSIMRTLECLRSLMSMKHAPPMNGSRVITDFSGVATII